MFDKELNGYILVSNKVYRINMLIENTLILLPLPL